MIAPVAVTCGDPAGIGPDLVLQLPQHLPDTAMVALGDISVLSERARQLGQDVALHPWQPGHTLPTQGL
ncbi:MAG: 4-hydroxythreonine-4-phosphate dehydrogenase PdxA, partial [Alcanivoracaceae bacterium]|nr:4-hydroxythreonine-4-phosphate dehydrogenase PdxA [Alcanivoracaceae bacterium]